MVEQLAVKILQLSVERRIEKRGEIGEVLLHKEVRIIPSQVLFYSREGVETIFL